VIGYIILNSDNILGGSKCSICNKEVNGNCKKSTIENYDTSTNINKCTCNAPTNDGVIDCNCKVPIVIDPNAKPPPINKKLTASSGASSSFAFKNKFGKRANYRGAKYDSSNKLIFEYDSTTTLPLLYLPMNYSMSSLIVYYMMFKYDYYYVLGLSRSQNSAVNENTRVAFNNYLEPLIANMESYVSSHLVNSNKILNKVNIDMTLDLSKIEEMRNYVAAQVNPVITYINIHAFAIGLIKSAYNNIHDEVFEADVQGTIDTLMSEKVTTMSEEGFIGSQIAPYSFYTFSSAPIIEAYEPVSNIPNSYNRVELLPFLELNEKTKNENNNEILNPNIFYKDYKTNELTDILIFILYDYKGILRETEGNGIEDIRNPTKPRIRDDNYRKGHREVADGLEEAWDRNYKKVMNDSYEIIKRNNRFGTIPSVGELDENCERITSVINTCIVDVNKVIDILNYIKENWAFIDTLQEHECNPETYKKMYRSTYGDKNDGGIRMLLDKLSSQE
jgi:hypothetical protein